MRLKLLYRLPLMLLLCTALNAITNLTDSKATAPTHIFATVPDGNGTGLAGACVVTKKACFLPDYSNSSWVIQPEKHKHPFL